MLVLFIIYCLLYNSCGKLVIFIEFVYYGGNNEVSESFIFGEICYLW